MSEKLYLHHQKINAQDWQQAVEELGLSSVDPTYSWYEPNPESLLDAKLKETPIVCFFKGKPEIPNGVTWSRLMLFYENGGLTLVPDGKDLRCVRWQTNHFKDSSEISPVVSASDKALLKTQDRLKSQFGLKKDIGLFPNKDNDGKAGSPEIIEYYHQGKCIAWTLM